MTSSTLSTSSATSRILGIPASIRYENITRNSRGLHMEVYDPNTNSVWLCQDVITREEYDAFHPEAPFLKSGIGSSSADFSYFLRSPGAPEEGLLQVKVIGGREFSFAARPLNFRGIARDDTPTLVQIDKHHVLGFHAGTRIHGALLPDGGYYLRQTESVDGKAMPVPSGWKMFSILLDTTWQWTMTNPVPIHFFRNLSSYAGRFERHELPSGEMTPE